MKTDTLIKLETKSLILEPPDIRFAQDVLEYSNDPEFCRYIDAKPAADIEECKEFMKNLSEENVKGKRAYWVIVQKSEKKAIGTIGFIFKHALRHKVAEIGYGLGRAYWGQGLFQEAMKEVLKFGFEDLQLERIQAIAREDNQRAIKGIEKIGFIQEAVFKSFYETVEGRKNGVLLRILKEDFLEKFDKGEHHGTTRCR